ncbi:MAG: ParA family protein [Planctomycetota bacterium]|nr:MAG: ParA family protein [Planctomycetota bacterium]
MGIVVGFISEKGGVGKTTTCYHIAVGLQRYHQKRVLCVDTDYQRGGLTCRFLPALIENFRDGHPSAEFTLYDRFQHLYSGAHQSPTVTILDTPSHIALLPADPRLSQVTVERMPASNNIRENNRLLWQHLAVLDAVLQPIRSEYDFILVDSHPELSDLLRTVVYACNYCVSPVKLDLQSTIGVPSAIQAINEVNSDMEMIANATGSRHGFVPTAFSGAIAVMAREWGGMLIGTQRTEYRRLQQSCGIFREYVTEGDGLRQAAVQRCPVYDIAGANAEKQAHHYRRVTQEFIERCPQ